MTETDELRHLLDETGVEWTDCSYKDTCTAWSSNGITWYGLWRDGSIELLAHHLTPAQAIAATVGPCSDSCNCTNSERTSDERGTCHMETDDSCQNWNSCSECGADYYTDQPINFCPNCGRKVVDE